MKILLFTPIVSSSVIGRVVLLLVKQMMLDGHEIVVVRSEAPELQCGATHAFGVGIVSWTDQTRVSALTLWADAIIYHIADNYSLHQGALTWLMRKAGIVCLHDYFVGNLFHAWALYHPDKADNLFQHWYGHSLPADFFFFTNADSVVHALINTPMTEWICSMALGVVTHSDWDLQRICNSCPGPISIMPLAYELTESFERNSIIKSTSVAQHKQKFTLLTVGYINENKRSAAVIEAIASHPLLKQQVCYQLIGAITDEVQIELMLLSEKLDVQLIISGIVDETTLVDAIAAADMMCCLRYPVLEASSASTIEAMLCGKPTIVTNTKFYQALPDDCVYKIEPAHEVADLRKTLLSLIEDPLAAQDTGRRAALWAAKTHSVEHYVTELLAFCAQVACATPMLMATHFFARTLIDDWGGDPGSIPLNALCAPLQIFEGEE